jgi:ABC-type branched-subunit amino acid transport system ATPase component
MIAPVLKVSDMKKAYGAIQAVGGVSFEVMPGEIFGVIGPNGSGLAASNSKARMSRKRGRWSCLA